MKKILLTALTALCLSMSASAQNLDQDVTYYKLLNKLWAMSGSFDKVAFHLGNHSVELKQTREAELETLGKLYAAASTEYTLLQAKEYDEKEYKKLGEMLVAMERSLADLGSEKWTTDPMWQYGYNVVKQRLGQLETTQQAVPQLSKNE